MSAAAARRKKQLAMRASAAAASSSATIGGGDIPEAASDPVRLRLDALLRDPSLSTESVAYEALQLAQSSVRRYVKLGKPDEAASAAFVTSLALLRSGGRVSVSSQLMTVLVGVLVETHRPCTPEWVKRFGELDCAHKSALDADGTMSPDERGRLQRLHLQFLKKALKWSNYLGRTRHGDPGMHALLGDHCWNMSCDETVVGNEAERGERAAIAAAAAASASGGGEEEEDDDGDDDGDCLDIGLRNEAVTHYALAGDVGTITRRLASLPRPTPEELAYGHVVPPPSATRSSLGRYWPSSPSRTCAWPGSSLGRTYPRSKCSRPHRRRSVERRAQSRISRQDRRRGTEPRHFLLHARAHMREGHQDRSIVHVAREELRAGVGTMHDPEAVRAYTMKIGRVYFDIQPPPSMMSMMETMMSGMGGGGGCPAG